MATGVIVFLAILGAVVCGAIAAVYRRDIRRERERVAGGSRMIQTACGPIEYAVAGDGPAVLVVHGAGGGFDQGLDLGQALVAHGFRVIAMSRFGYLRTPLPAVASAAAQADAHACLLDALGIERVAIFGASAGAPSSMQFALRHPQRCSALVLLVPAAFVPRPGAAPSLRAPPRTLFLFETALKSDFLFWAILKIARSTAIRSILGTPPELVGRARADERARVDEVLSHILPVVPRRLGLLNDAAVTSTLPRYELERIQAPTLCISVADDLYGTFEPARYSAGHIPLARFIGYPSGGHICVGHQQEIADAVVAFLR